MVDKHRQQKSKGNPASKRMLNEHRKAGRSLSWRRGKTRKERNREAQAARERENRRRDGLTPWKQARAARKARRAADPKVQARARAHRENAGGES
jgi:hypothetical protein